MIRLLAVAIALAIAAPAARAQPTGARITLQQRRERIKQRIRALRAYRLTVALSLDGKTAGRLFPVLAKYDRKFDRLLHARARLRRRLARVARGGDPRAANQVIDAAIANQRALWNVEAQRLAELRTILTPAQTAKLLIVLPRLERKIENRVRAAIRARRRAAGGP